MDPPPSNAQPSFDSTYYSVEPTREITPAKALAFEDLSRQVASAGGAQVEVSLPYPMHEFLWWLTEEKGFLLHGTNDGGIEVFEPRRQGDAFDRPVTAVFASSDPIWPMWFALLNRQVWQMTSNDCLVTRAGRMYRFAVDRRAFEMGPFTNGWLYVLDRAGFSRTRADNGTPTEEWTNPSVVKPLARVAVTPDDFPFRDAAGPVDYTGNPTRVEAAFRNLVLQATEIAEVPEGFTFLLEDEAEGHAVAREVAAAFTEHSPLRGLIVEVGGNPHPVVTLSGPRHVKEAIRSLTEGIRPA
jgi:hypothetical protein